eukprot:TRINITY_DN30951_c0_g1_i1.p1 TRINITY_DN30951_c0_g1~~TRINITY_DN30951_c0_g1_i1.p1  ORF type:complete len:260 (+),score=74.47 TRINITY_DN30951_c0_g1_i1:41-820(+)
MQTMQASSTQQTMSAPSPTLSVPADTAAGVTADEVAQALKAFNEGRVAPQDFFSPHRAEFHHPFFRVSNPLLIRLMCSVLAVACHTDFDVKSSVGSARQRRGSRTTRRSATPPTEYLSARRGDAPSVFLVEGEATYTPKWRVLGKPTSRRFYTTLTLDCEASAPGSPRFTKLEPVRESYTLSLPARILTTPLVAVATIAAVIVGGLIDVTTATLGWEAAAEDAVPPPGKNVTPRLAPLFTAPGTPWVAVSVWAMLLGSW